MESYCKLGKTTFVGKMFFIIAIGLLIYGCVFSRLSKAPVIDFEKLQSIDIGFTTREEIVERFGEPFVIKRDAYIYENMFWPGDAGSTFRRELYIYFDENDAVVRTLFGEENKTKDTGKGIGTIGFNAKDFYEIINLREFTVGETTIAEAESLPYDMDRIDIYENGRLLEYVLSIETTGLDKYGPLGELLFVGIESNWLVTIYLIGFTKDGLLKPAEELTGIYSPTKNEVCGGIYCVLAASNSEGGNTDKR